MVGPAFDAVQNGIQTLINEIYSDPVALETAALSVITFRANAKVAVPLTEIPQFQKPKLVLGSGTSLGLALDLVSQRLKTEVRVQTKDVKGDWKPIVFILTDGKPTDTWFKSADRFKAEITGKIANVITVACGPDVQISDLRRITDITLTFRDPTEISFTHFLKWVSQSVQTTSHRFSGDSGSRVSLPELPDCMEVATPNLLADCNPKRFHQGSLLPNRGSLHHEIRADLGEKSPRDPKESGALATKEATLWRCCVLSDLRFRFRLLWETARAEGLQRFIGCRPTLSILRERDVDFRHELRQYFLHRLARPLHLSLVRRNRRLCHDRRVLRRDTPYGLISPSVV
jgi:uncharacterized protein YegL